MRVVWNIKIDHTVPSRILNNRPRYFGYRYFRYLNFLVCPYHNPDFKINFYSGLPKEISSLITSISGLWYGQNVISRFVRLQRCTTWYMFLRILLGTCRSLWRKSWINPVVQLDWPTISKTLIVHNLMNIWVTDLLKSAFVIILHVDYDKIIGFTQK